MKRLLAFFYGSTLTTRWLNRQLTLCWLRPKETTIYTYWLDASAHGIATHPRRRQLAGQVSRAHGFDVYEAAHRPPYLPFRRDTISGPDVIFAVSEHGRAHLAHGYPEFEGFRVARLGVRDPGPLGLLPTGQTVRVVSCSFVRPVKRLPLLIDAIARLVESRPKLSVEWHHIGDGPKLSELRKLASRTLAHNSFFMHGRLSNDEVHQFYRSHPVDAFVNVSASEGVPVSIMEAQSYGIPVIATAVGGTGEIVNLKTASSWTATRRPKTSRGPSWGS